MLGCFYENPHLPELADLSTFCTAPSPLAEIEQPAVLSPAQEQALEWLIGGGSVGEAAQFAGVSRQTISRWLRSDPAFRTVYEAWKQECAEMLQGRLIAAGESAMDNLVNAVRARGNVQASQFIIKTLMAQKTRRRE